MDIIGFLTALTIPEIDPVGHHMFQGLTVAILPSEEVLMWLHRQQWGGNSRG